MEINCPTPGDEQQLPMSLERTPNYLARVLASAVYTLFLTGALVLAFSFYRSVRDIIAYSPLSSGLQLPLAGDPVLRPDSVPDWSQRERVNILLLGVDQRPDEEGPWRSDSMIVVTVDPRSLTAGALSIPRDLYVEIPGYGEQRINMAHFLGDAYDYPGGGPALTMKTIEYNLGMPVHYYIRINFQGFREVINYLGGITIDVEEEIWDYRYPDGQYGYTTIHIPAGTQLMDGRTALQYARTRHSGTDFDRLRRQQQVLMAIRQKALRLDLIPKIPALANTMGQMVSTNLQLGEVMTLAQIASQIDAEDIRFGVIDETMTVPIVLEDGAEVLFPIRDKIRQAVEEIFYPAADE
jgi:LCP family protein required for cell wall assembly